MTEGTSSKLVFSRLKRQKVEGYFDGGRLTSDAGAMLLREVDRRLGLTSALAACITDPRCVRRIRHDRHRMLTQRVFGIGLGYEDLNDHQSLRDEPLFQVLVAQR
ncbi:MAG TPA: transposase, partial [Phycisphaerae bacterium]|nr:transposase [Phycisphaerae bacterium]